jgi:Mn-dependent DtxR family transcriptional regulator
MVKDIEAMLAVSKPTANAIVKSLTEANILKEKTGYARNRVFVLHEYLELFNK